MYKRNIDSCRSQIIKKLFNTVLTKVIFNGKTILVRRQFAKNFNLLGLHK